LTSATSSQGTILRGVHGTQPRSGLSWVAWLILALAALLVAVWFAPYPVISEGFAQYVPFHTFMETFAVVVSMLVFAVGWNAYVRERARNLVFLSCAFLAVGLIDFAHILSFPGMPDFVTPASNQKSILFWMAARLMDALALAAVALLPWKPFASPRARYVPLSLCLVYTGAVYWLGLWHADWLPTFFVPGKGLTPFKIGTEWTIIGIHLATVIALIWRGQRPQPFGVAFLLAAAATTAMSEVLFTLYATASDQFNALGHVYKVVAYCFVYRAVFVDSVRQPYRKLERSERALRQSEARVSTIFRASPVAISLSTLEDGVYLDVNDKYLEGLGYRADEVVGHTVSELRVWESTEELKKFVSALREHGSFRNLEFRGRTKSGELRDALMSAELIELEGKQCVLAMTLDITERKRAENAMRWLASIVESTNDAIFSTDLELKIEQWNHGAEMLFGYRPEEIIGRPIEVLIPTRHLSTAHTFAKLALAGEHLEPFDAKAVTKSGTQVAISQTVSPVFDAAGSVVGLCCISRDVTARMRAEAVIRELNETLERRVAARTAELERMNRELEAFSYSVSHDLRAPLRAINGFARIVLDNEAANLSEEGRDMLARVVRSALHMGELIDDMLDFSRVSRSEFVPTQVDMRALADSVIDELRDQYPTAAIELLRMPEALGDKTMLRQVYVNLVGNALKFSARKQRPVVQIGATQQGGETVFFVKDNGAGFDMAYVEKLFGVFQRLHSMEAFPGTGVGLAIVKRIVERHGGKVWAEAELEKGATFYFTLPDQYAEAA
jgi:PAS domain S-box-containing protein